MAISKAVKRPSRKLGKKKARRQQPASTRSPARGNVFLRFIRGQLPVTVAIAACVLIPYSIGFDGEAYRLIVLALLGTVVYTAFRSGLLQGLISAILAIAFNTYILSGSVEAFSLNDSAVRSILLIIIILPSVAAVVGYLKERSDYFLAREKHARVQAEKSEQRLRFMAETMPQKIFTTKPDGNVDYFNQQWIDYSGLPFKQLKNRGWARLIHPDDVEENMRRWQHSIDTGEPFQMELRLKDADGAYRWHLSRAEALRDNQDSLMMWIGSSTDIEEVRRTRRLEASTKRLIEDRRQLVTINKAKDEFISLASHQLRTPATGVKQYLGMVLEGYSGAVPKQQRGMLGQAYESNERQLTIIDDLLKVAQLDAGKVKLHLEKTNLVALVKDVLEEQSPAFTRRQQMVVFKPGRKVLAAKVDSDRVRMVLENLIDNAGKYTPQGKKIEIRLARTDSNITVSIIDEGVGIEPADRKKIFQKFIRLKSPLLFATEGSGLGLYWAKKIVDLHGGSIKVASQPDEGSTFTLTLPMNL